MRKYGAEKIIEEIIAKNFSTLATNLQIQVQWITSSINTKKMPLGVSQSHYWGPHIWRKWEKQREKLRAAPTGWPRSRNSEARRQSDSISLWRAQRRVPSEIYTQQVSFKNEDETTTLSDRRKLGICRLHYKKCWRKSFRLKGECIREKLSIQYGRKAIRNSRHPQKDKDKKAFSL